MFASAPSLCLDASNGKQLLLGGNFWAKFLLDGKRNICNSQEHSKKVHILQGFVCVAGPMQQHFQGVVSVP